MGGEGSNQGPGMSAWRSSAMFVDRLVDAGSFSCLSPLMGR